MDTWINKICGC